MGRRPGSVTVLKPCKTSLLLSQKGSGFALELCKCQDLDWQGIQILWKEKQLPYLCFFRVCMKNRFGFADALKKKCSYDQATWKKCFALLDRKKKVCVGKCCTPIIIKIFKHFGLAKWLQKCLIQLFWHWNIFIIILLMTWQEVTFYHNKNSITIPLTGRKIGD